LKNPRFKGRIENPGLGGLTPELMENVHNPGLKYARRIRHCGLLYHEIDVPMGNAL
jgi:hypothetical protein